MRYQEVVRQYLSVRESVSREWWLVPESLVMCVEIDMSADSYLTSAHASQRCRGPRLVRMTIFRVLGGADPPIVSSPSDASEPQLTDAESMAIAHHRAVVEEWISGRRDELPPSTSTAIASRLARAR